MLLDLKRAMGVQLDSDITLSGYSRHCSTTRGSRRQSHRGSSRSRPELVAARARLDSARAQAGAAKGAYKPQVYGAAMGDTVRAGRHGQDCGRDGRADREHPVA